MKTHLALRTRDLARSTQFYQVLLDAKPAKQLDDYVLFITEEPGIELALSPSQHAAPDRSAHFGIAVEDEGAVGKAIERFQKAGLAVDVERDEVCCYARQNKVWASDPDGRRWEVYHVIEEADSACGTGTSICCSLQAQAACC